MLEAMQVALEEIKKFSLMQEEFAKRTHKLKVSVPEITVDEVLKAGVESSILDKIKQSLENREKLTREKALEEIKRVL